MWKLFVFAAVRVLGGRGGAGAGFGQKQRDAWRHDCGIGEEGLTWKKVSHDRLLTLCALLTRLIGIVPAGCMKLERELM